MKATRETMSLISAVEYEIGNSCYNAESYNGWTDEYGCSFRYPFVYEVKDEEENIHTYKSRLRIADNKDITSKNIRTVCYKFGANELCIGAAVVDILTMLEERYQLDFVELEKNYQKSIKKKEK